MKRTVLMTLLAMAVGTQAYALDREALKQEILQEVRQEMQAASKGASVLENLSFSGAVETDFSYRDVNEDGADKSESDLTVGTVEFGIEAKPHEMVTGTVLFKAEDIGTDDEDLFVDEAFVTIKGKNGLYAVAGKNAKPFGQLATHTISDPEALDFYEVLVPGLTLGYAPENMMGLDLSMTLYKSAEMMHDYKSDTVESFIANASLAPVDGLTAGVAYASEPGEGDRVDTLNLFAEYTKGAITLDAEYFTALSREKDDAGKEAKENAIVVGAAFQAADALELALRYESYDLDKKAEEGDLDQVIVAGCNYSVLEGVDLMAEYRAKQVEDAGNSSYEDQVNEFNVRVALGF